MQARKGSRGFPKKVECGPVGVASKVAPQPEAIKPTLPQVIVAMQSLYTEELKPFGRILRKRVAELAPCSGGAKSVGAHELPDVDAFFLRHVCETSCLVRVEREDGGDYSALFPGALIDFVDVYSPHDPYPHDLWAQVTAYFENLGVDDPLPGGRYACGQMLVKRGLPFLVGRSLGQVCHIVQLAISQRKIIGYHNGTLVPYTRSRSKQKEQCAGQQQPCSSTGSVYTTMPLATWDTARSCLIKILETARGPRPGMVPLSNVKRLFRSRFRIDLSETALGQSKLCDLLQDPRFQDICEVRLESNGYTVIKRTNPCKPKTICLVDELFAPSLQVQCAPNNFIESAESLFDVPMISTDFSEMPAEWALATDSPIGEFLWSKLADVVEHQPKLANVVEHHTWFDSPSTENPKHISVVAHSSASACVVQNSFIHIAPVPPTPIPGARRRAQSLPSNRSACNVKSCELSFARPAERLSAPNAVSFSPNQQESTLESEPRRVLFCQDEPLNFAALTSPDALHPSPVCSPAETSNLSAYSPRCIMPSMQAFAVPPTPLCLVPSTPSPTCCSSNGSFCKIMTAGFVPTQVQQRLKFCPDEPLDLLDAAEPITAVGGKVTCTPRYVSPYSPQHSPLPAISPAPWKLVPPTPSPTSCPSQARPPLGRLLGQPLCPPGLETTKGAILHLSQVLQLQEPSGC